MDANALQSKGLGRFLAEGRSCETNPIRPGIGFQGSGISPLTPDPHPLPAGAPAAGQSCKTNPIPGRRGQCLCVQTNPMWGKSNEC
jgi:hypothetical protein